MLFLDILLEDKRRSMKGKEIVGTMGNTPKIRYTHNHTSFHIDVLIGSNILTNILAP